MVSGLTNGRSPARVVNSVAPIRVCDNGGWTDTWFAGHGRIFNIGVYPYAEVQIEVFRRAAPTAGSSSTPRTTASATPWPRRTSPWDRHPLLEAAIEYMKVPEDLHLEVTIYLRGPGRRVAPARRPR